MASPAAKAKMQILAAGSNSRPLQRAHPPTRLPARRAASGFTLLELLVVVSIIAIASAGVIFSLRDSAQAQTEREAMRLVALLESARAQSRTLGVAVVWRSTATGFVFDGLPEGSLPQAWLDGSTTVADSSRLELGPEPLIAPQSVTLHTTRQPGVAWRVQTDGLRPFGLQWVASATPDANGAP
jgi:general secretion pathway protein H